MDDKGEPISTGFKVLIFFGCWFLIAIICLFGGMVVGAYYSGGWIAFIAAIILAYNTKTKADVGRTFGIAAIVGAAMALGGIALLQALYGH